MERAIQLVVDGPPRLTPQAAAVVLQIIRRMHHVNRPIVYQERRPA